MADEDGFEARYPRTQEFPKTEKSMHEKEDGPSWMAHASVIMVNSAGGAKGATGLLISCVVPSGCNVSARHTTFFEDNRGLKSVTQGTRTGIILRGPRFIQRVSSSHLGEPSENGIIEHDAWNEKIASLRSPSSLCWSWLGWVDPPFSLISSF